MIRKFIVLFGLLAVSFLTFANSLDNPFLIDDHAFFDEKLKNVKYLPLHFLPDKNKILKIEGESADPFYRPLATIVPMLMHLAFRDNVVGYHVANTVLFALAGWGIFLFLRFLGASALLAILTAVFYIVHPINGVTVNYITASVFSIQIILMLLSLYCLMRAVQSSNIFVSVLSHGAAVIFYLLSTFCHETAMFLPFYAFILLFVIALNEKSIDFKVMTQNAFGSFVKSWPLFIALVIYFFWRMNNSSLEASILDKISRYDMNFVEYLATWTKLLFWYISRLFYPEGIVLILAHQPLKQILPIIGWISVLISFITLAIFLLWRNRNDQFALLGLLWFIFGFAPFTLACFFQPIHGLMIEPHWFLFPVIGFFIFLVRIFEKAFLNRNKPLLIKTAVAVLLCSWLVMSWRHNEVWGDEVRYCTWWLNHSPDFVAVNAYIAKAYELRNENDMARVHYQKSIKRGYKNYIAYTNMGLMAMKEGNWDIARENLLMALKEDPHASVAISNLGAIEFKNENYLKALEYFEKCKELDRFAMLPRLNISKTYLKLNDFNKAAQTLEEALEIVPHHEIALVNLIKIYIDQKDKENTLKVAQWILERSQNPNALNNVAIIFKQNGMDDLANKAYLRSKQKKN